ncbi:hypothetical protein LINPERPRIM_LOCUS12021, partial [Linum perenne]
IIPFFFLFPLLVLGRSPFSPIFSPSEHSASFLLSISIGAPLSPLLPIAGDCFSSSSLPICFVLLTLQLVRISDHFTCCLVRSLWLPYELVLFCVLQMPVAKLKAANTADAMKSEDGNDSLDTFIRQAMGKEPLLSFPRTNDNPVQWIQLLQALDQQQDGPGWPLLTPLKVQMQKCDKCSREFCSSINYRRHTRVHHRLKKLDKDTAKNRNLLGAFWDKLCEDEAKEILSFKDVALEELSGSSIIKALMALNRKQGFSPLPLHCLRAGITLSDIIQGRFRYPLSSEELFSILDDASEKTFLCGAAILMQKYIFDGEASKTGLETKNVVACTSFLVEQKLVKAWLADKDAEALRCQKLLVEEEEAAQRRQAEILERKRQKKLRQKEQRAKEQQQDEKADTEETNDETSEALAETPCSTACSTDLHDVEMLQYPCSSSSEPLELADHDEDLDLESQIRYRVGTADQGRDHIPERQAVQGTNRRHVARRHLPQKSQWNHVPNGFHASGNKYNGTLAHGTYRESRSVAMVNGNRKWTRKPRVDHAGETLKPRLEREVTVSQQDQANKRQVLIGSISVAIESSGPQNSNTVEQQVPKKSNVQDKYTRADRPVVKQWRPVSRNGSKVQLQQDESCIVESQVDDASLRSSPGQVLADGPLQEEGLVHPERLQFSSQAAKALLAERWKQALATEHVKLVLAPILEPSKAGHQNGKSSGAHTKPSEGTSVDVSGSGVKANKFRGRPDKGVKLKYIPKQRTLS